MAREQALTTHLKLSLAWSDMRPMAAKDELLVDTVISANKLPVGGVEKLKWSYFKHRFSTCMQQMGGTEQIVM